MTDEHIRNEIKLVGSYRARRKIAIALSQRGPVETFHHRINIKLRAKNPRHFAEFLRVALREPNLTRRGDVERLRFTRERNGLRRARHHRHHAIACEIQPDHRRRACDFLLLCAVVLHAEERAFFAFRTRENQTIACWHKFKRSFITCKRGHSTNAQIRVVKFESFKWILDDNTFDGLDYCDRGWFDDDLFNRNLRNDVWCDFHFHFDRHNCWRDNCRKHRRLRFNRLALLHCFRCILEILLQITRGVAFKIAIQHHDPRIKLFIGALGEKREDLVVR